MTRHSVQAAAVCALLALSGCIDSSTKITVKPDGSGTVEKTIVLSRHLAELMKQMGNTSDAATIERGMLNEAGLKAGASQMGAEVSFVSAEKVTSPKGNGYKVLYRFKDIAKVKLNQNPAADLTMPSTGAAGAADSTQEYLTFKFVKGTPAVLTIVAPKIKASGSSQAAAPAASSADTDKMMASFKPLYSDMRIALSVEVEGKITQTNAAYASGSTVTLLDMDFAKILADDAMLKKLSGGQSKSMTEVKDMVKSLPGVVIDTQDAVSISFR